MGSKEDERLIFLVEKLSQDLSEIKKEIKDLNDNLYDPNSGIYAKIKDIEYKANTSQDKFANIKQIGFMGLGTCLTIIGSVVIKIITS